MDLSEVTPVAISAFLGGFAAQAIRLRPAVVKRLVRDAVEEVLSRRKLRAVAWDMLSEVRKRVEALERQVYGRQEVRRWMTEPTPEDEEEKS